MFSDYLAIMEAHFKELIQKLEEVKDSLQKQIQGVDEKMCGMQSQINVFVNRIEKVEADYKLINKEVELFKTRIDGLQSYNRANNVILYNLMECNN